MVSIAYILLTLFIIVTVTFFLKLHLDAIFNSRLTAAQSKPSMQTWLWTAPIWVNMGVTPLNILKETWGYRFSLTIRLFLSSLLTGRDYMQACRPCCWGDRSGTCRCYSSSLEYLVDRTSVFAIAVRSVPALSSPLFSLPWSWFVAFWRDGFTSWFCCYCLVPVTDGGCGRSGRKWFEVLQCGLYWAGSGQGFSRYMWCAAAQCHHPTPLSIIRPITRLTMTEFSGN